MSDEFPTPEKSPLQATASAPEDIDPQLMFLVGLAGRGINFGMTLFVGGTVITGQLISAADYYRSMGELGQRAISGEGGAEWKAQHDQLADRVAADLDNKPLSELPQPWPFRHIHLRDAQFLRADGTFVPPRRNGILWRGKLTSVDAFVWGQLEKE